ncbi:MAG: hypothetical protein J2P15_13505 [Micromonosporaceae bacterium]|nr:hypothetical protein [Micromonosporaceae bacterium]
MSVQQDWSPDDLGTGYRIPAQRSGSPLETPPSANIPPAANIRPPANIPPASASPAAGIPSRQTVRPEPPRAGVPGTNDETMVLPVFVTGKKPEPPQTQPSPSESLPSSERGMLAFVAALLALGTLAVVAMMGFGLTGKPKPSGAAASATRDPAAPSPTAPAVVVPPDPSPALSIAPSPSRPHRSPTPRRTTSSPRLLGTLSMGDLFGYCQGRSPQLNGGQWSCGGGNGQTFTPTTICRFRFNDRTAFAAVGDIRDPTTWRCFT